MASIVTRGKKTKKHSVTFSYKDKLTGATKQRWETFDTFEEAMARKKEIETTLSITKGYMTFTEQKIKTLNDLLDKYIEFYGTAKWSESTYSSNLGMMNNYIRPHLGDLLLTNISTRVLDNYYQYLRTSVTAAKCGKVKGLVSDSTAVHINKLLRSAFNLAIKWELVEKNPCEHVTLPSVKDKKRDIWTKPELEKAFESAKDNPKYYILNLAMHLSFACSLRAGELLALTLKDLDVSDEAIRNESAYLVVNKELERVNREAMSQLNQKDVLLVFPPATAKRQSTTALVLKKPKTESSNRKVFIPNTVARMIRERIDEIREDKEMFGTEYSDYGLLLCSPAGRPIESRFLRVHLKEFCEEYGLPQIVFHSLRHSSITYKLKLSYGDVKTVQGDSGHSVAAMVTDRYNHIIDEDRRMTASKLDRAFYHNETPLSEQQPSWAISEGEQATALTPELVNQIVSNPQFMAQILSQLVKIQ